MPILDDPTIASIAVAIARVEEKLDFIIRDQTKIELSLAAQVVDHKTVALRVTKLETSKAYTIGWMAGIAAAVTAIGNYLVAKFGGV